MKINTRHFGELEIQEENIIAFEDGIPGFEDTKQYVVIENPDPEVLFHWLQSVDDPHLAFVIINPFVFKSDYEFQLTDRIVDKLGIETPEDLIIYAIVVVPEDINLITANLAAPIVINTKNHLAKQVVLENSPYHTKHLILEEIKKAEQAG